MSFDNVNTSTWTEDDLGLIENAGDVGGDIQISDSVSRQFAMALDNGQFAVIEFTAYVASESIDDDHGPVPATWFGRGVWPTCQCGYSPYDNGKLTSHWRTHGFEVIDDHGHLVKKYNDAWVQIMVRYSHCTDLEDLGMSETHADIRYWDMDSEDPTTPKERIANLTVEDLNEAVNQMGV